MQLKNYYLGLDIGSNSVGYAVTDTEYNLLKFNRNPAWGVTVFDEAALKAERRVRRTTRRRYDRKKERIHLLQELFAPEIAKVDERFFIRLQESQLYREDTGDSFTFFCDSDYTDVDYFREYPTIHHLITELMDNPAPHDARLVYLACAWLVAHRGHFLSNVNKDKLGDIRDFDTTFRRFNAFFTDNEYLIPWSTDNVDEIAAALKAKEKMSAKVANLTAVLMHGKKFSKVPQEGFPYSLNAIIKLLAGKEVPLKDLFAKDEYDGKVSLNMSEDSYADILTAIGDDFELITALRSVYDWAVLSDILGDQSTISAAKKAVYYQHMKDLAFLKHVLRKYSPADYKKMFFNPESGINYTCYVHNAGDYNSDLKELKNIEDFFKYVLKVVSPIKPDEEDKEQFEDMMQRLEFHTFLPKQKSSSNRVIPYQLYWYELDRILNNAEKYLPFLTEVDEDGYSVSYKIRSIFLFKVPYFVGPTNENSCHAWLKRKQGKIYPWNFNEMVDLDASEEQFIRRMTNTCTYLPGESVLPKDSLCYHKFMVLNELNNICINGLKLSVELKQNIYNDLFMRQKKVKKESLITYLIRHKVIEKGQETSVSGIDDDIHSNLTPQIAFRNLLQKGILSEEDAERIIERSSYAEDNHRLDNWLLKNYPKLSEENRKYLCSIKVKGFGRLSKKFLCELEGADTETGESFTILSALWNTQHNLMELLSKRYTFLKNIDEYVNEYYAENPHTLEERLDEMYASNAVRRVVYRVFDIVKDVTKVFGEPQKIFIETTRGAMPDQKGKRTKSRKQQILDLYKKFEKTEFQEDVCRLQKELESLGNGAEKVLQSDRVFLYFMQLGRCLYSNEYIIYDAMAGKSKFNIEHIYPQSVVKDDSVLNNKILANSKINDEKKNNYPVSSEIQTKMRPFWEVLKEKGAITEEKFRRLTRTEPFSNDERWEFINRQLNETSHATKIVATLLKERYPQIEVVYSKAGLVSDFRQEFKLLKSRSYNDLHHAVDAYLNIVVGNVYNMKFSKQWFNITSEYSLKCDAIFKNSVICSKTTVWDPEYMLPKVQVTAARNNAHFTKYAFIKTGKLFDEKPVSKASGLVPLKNGMDTEKYGGYNKASISFLLPVHYKAGKKEDTIILPIAIMYKDRFFSDTAFANEYIVNRISSIIGKPVDEVSFPLGMKPWKINTVLSFDGFRMCITGNGNKGKVLKLQSLIQFSTEPKWSTYMKKLERLAKKAEDNKSYIFSEEYDKVNREDNKVLYDLYINKLTNSIYQKRPNIPIDTLVAGKEKFKDLSEIEQAKLLLKIQELFRASTGRSDLSGIGGVANTGSITCSTLVSNWKNKYKDVRLINMSPSGLWEQRSKNLLDIL